MTKLDASQIQSRLERARAHRASVGPDQLVEILQDTFRLEPVGDDEFLFTARASTDRERLFGGQVIAQAMVAAAQTVDDAKSIHSLHAYFLRAGSEVEDLRFRVHRDFDGRSFSNRRVVVRQQDKVIFNLTASFQIAADGLEFQRPMPEILPPEQCADMIEQIAQNARIPDKFIERMSRPRPFDIRSHRAETGNGAAMHYQWIRPVAPLRDDPLTHRAALAFASDMGLLSSGMIPHGLHWTTPGLFSTSLDHAMWFHADFRFDDWLVYVMEADWTGGARSLNRGSIYTRDGQLVATATQEGLMRLQS